MKPENFISKINNSLKTGHFDDELLSYEVRFFRSKYILKMIENFSKILNTFQFKDTIIFQDNKPYINLNGIRGIKLFEVDGRNLGKKLIKKERL